MNAAPAAPFARPGIERPIRILFVFAWLVVGGEETEVRLLAEHLDPAFATIDVVACFRREGMPEQTHEQLRAAGVRVDTTPYTLDFDQTVAYLASRVPGYDLIVSSQNVADIYPALERLHLRPPLIEHGGLVSEAEAGPKHFTSRYVGVCDTIRAAAARRMPDRPHHALAIPSMVDTAPFDAALPGRAGHRAALGIASDRVVAVWLGRLDAKKRVEDVIAAMALAAPRVQALDLLIVGGPDAFMPEYAVDLRAQADATGLGDRIRFLGDRADVANILAAADLFVWLSRGEGMPHVIAEAGAARLPVIATPDNGALEQITDGVSGLFVPHQSPAAVADAMVRLASDAALRTRLGNALRDKVDADYAIPAVMPLWEALIREVVAERPRTTHRPSLFHSMFLGGFECSSHQRHTDRQRRDMIALTQHDLRAEADYRLLRAHGILSARDGLRWHLIEAEPGVYDWSSIDAQLAAARATGMQVVWDLLHYGWPLHIDLWGTDFADRFTAFALAAVERIMAHGGPDPLFCPVNEISFFGWGGGDVAYLGPFARGRGQELKVQLARATIQAIRAIRMVHPQARFVAVDPIISVLTDPSRPHLAAEAEGHRLSQFHAWDMLTGQGWAQLGGTPDCLDVVGVNFYQNNQWVRCGQTLDWRDPLARPLADMLCDTFARYGRPILIAETGTEGDARAAWLAMIGDQVMIAMDRGVPIEGVCLYPVLGHLGWDDDRYCPNGLIEWDPGVDPMADGGLPRRYGPRPADADRHVHGPLARELSRQQARFAARFGSPPPVPAAGRWTC